MLTVDFARFPAGADNRVLDLGCGDGRHACAASRLGAEVVALDPAASEVKHVRDKFDGMTGAPPRIAVRGDGLALPFPDGSFDRVIAAEVLEHIPDDGAMLAEAVRVLAPGGLLAVTVPRWWPERICWALSAEYHQVEGGHVRIYHRRRLRRMLTDAGLVPLGGHHAHALHSPYWWLKCLSPQRETRLIKRYHEFLVWDIMRGPRWVKLLERALNPVLGKSLVLYARKPA